MSEEYFDVVNEHNVIIGQEKRHLVHQTGVWHRGSHVFVLTSDGRMVVQRRSLTKDGFPGAFDCSVSEHAKVGEAYFACAIRGLQEELGLEKLSLRRLLQFKMNYGPNDNMISELYEAIYDGESLTIDPDETEEVAYYTIAEIEEMMASELASFAPWFVQLFRWYVGKETEMEVIWRNEVSLRNEN